MKTAFTRFVAVLLVLLTLCPLAFAAGEGEELTVLFTHDLHSHLLPSKTEEGGEFGGYARLMSVIEEQKRKAPNAILVDGGDFSMGSLFQTAYASSAIELRMMGAMGYDVTTFGNHEFDYLPQGLISMLKAAKASGESLPAIVDANYLPPAGEQGEPMRQALQDYGVKDYVLIERGGAVFAVFGIVGEDSDECAPNSGMLLSDPVATAQRTVDAAVAESEKRYGVRPAVICLSHSGTKNGEGEDYELAKGVKGIDVIVSAHTHTTLQEAITVNGTAIVSAGEYGKNLGVVRLSRHGGEYSVSRYELIPVNETVRENERIAALAEGFKATVEKDYLSSYGVSFDQVLVKNPYGFDSVDEVYATQHESTLGNLFSDAYKAAAEQALGGAVDVALTAAGVIRETLPKGEVTTSDVFNAASLGVGTEGELVAVYLTGADLKNALEVDASVQPLMRSAQLFFSGVEYSFNVNRMIFNKVDGAMLKRNDGILEEIDPDKLYRVVTGTYCGQMLGAVKEKSFGLLSITPRDEKGDPIAAEELVNFTVKDAEGKPVKEWFAIADYLLQMEGEVDGAYAAPDGRKTVYASWNPSDLLRNANGFTFVLWGGILLLILLAVWIVRIVCRKRKKKKNAA